MSGLQTIRLWFGITSAPKMLPCVVARKNEYSNESQD